MISSYFTEKKFDLNDIEPVINPKDFSNKDQDFWYLKTHTYNDFICVEDVFSGDDIDKIIKFGNLYVEEQAKIGAAARGAVDTNIRSCKVAWMFPNKHTQWIYQRISDLVNEINEKYFQFDLTKLETFQFTKYNSGEGGFYEKHVDPTSGYYLSENRKLSIVVQLSDPNDYEGGDLCLYHGREPTIFGKKRGGIIFFPSYTLHEVKPVTRGIRYSLVGWTHGPAFK